VVAEFSRLADRAPSPADSLAESLSERELQVLRLMAVGATNREIAAQLFITPGTVKNHVTNILGKLGVSDRTQAALKAGELRLL
jgi:DNA-binding NarL/FixJ family response regulator